MAIKKDKLFRSFSTVLNRPYVSITFVMHSIPAESMFRVNHKTYILGKKLLKLVFLRHRTNVFQYHHQEEFLQEMRNPFSYKVGFFSAIT